MSSTEAGTLDRPFDYDGRAVAITGASGFLGTAIRRRLCAAGAVVHAISRHAQPERGEAHRWWQLDVRVPGALDEALRTIQPDVLFHLAGETSAGRDLELVEPTLTANVVATVNALAAVARWSPATRLVWAGSLEEPTEPAATATSPYALSKATAAAYGRLFHELYETRAVGLRVFMAYGPGQAAVGKLIPYITLALLRGEPALLTSGVRRVDWVFVDDVADAFVAAGVADATVDGRTIDVGSGTTWSVREVAEELRRIVGGGDLRFGARPDRARELERVADTGAAAELLGWRAATSLADGLRATVAWYGDQLASRTSFRA
jgi:UDP-glucose 4-epimerase